MSLKAFHFVFVIASLILATWFSVWCFNEGSEAGVLSSVVMGTISLIVAICLSLYLGWIVRKLNRVTAALFLTLAIFSPSNHAWACAVCFGNPKSPLVQSANIAILFLLGIVGGILAGFGGLFLTWRSRAKKYESLSV